MGNLLNEIKSEQVQVGKKSRIAEILEKMSEAEQKDLIAALDDQAIPASKISRVMARRGHKLSVQVIYRYRSGDLAAKIK
ncbi:terminase small subunit [Actinomycetia phage DSL-LC01]|nr:terminase small subunit [Actinomycetia phage DSL-LC01]